MATNRARLSEASRRLWARLTEAATPVEPADDDFTLEDFSRALPNTFGHATRRIWCRDGRAHVELREFGPDDLEPLHAALRDACTSLGGAVTLHDLNSITGRAIFEYRAGALLVPDFDRLVSEAELRCGLGEREFPTDRPKYPADVEPIARLLIELTADSGAAGLGSLLRIIGFEPTKGEFDLAALVSMIENTPRLRRWLESKFGVATVDVGLGTTGSFLHAIGDGPVGPALELVLQTIKLRGEIARRWAWLGREQDLVARARFDETIEFERPERPQPLPVGDIEKYADEALYASLGGFAVGLLDTENLEASMAPLFGGLPKAARYGRESFVAELNRVLGDRRNIVMRPAALELLDRVDTIVVDSRALCDSDGEVDPHAENFGAATRAARMTFVLVGADHASRDILAPHEVVELGRDEWLEEALSRTVERLQREGHVVALVVAQHSRALLRADVGIGLPQLSVPWEADIITTNDLDDVTFIVEACAEARAVADESVVLAATGAAFGAIATVGGGLRKRAPGRVMVAVNSASVLALSNGIRRARQLERRPRPSAPDETGWHQMSIDEVVDRVESRASGLTSEEALARRPETDDAPEGRLRQFGRAVGKEMVNPFTPILAGGAALSAIVGSTVDAAIVGSAVALSALIGGFERYESERSITGLEDAAPRPPARVLRDGVEQTVEPDAVVVGDLLVLQAGEFVHADCRIVEARELEVDQSSLTGESLAVVKTPAPTGDLPLGDRASMLFEGTVVTSGTARAVVVATGGDTQAARAARLAHAPPESGVEQRLHEIAEITLPAAGISGVLLATVGLARGRKLRRIVGTGVGLAVASVPEGLPLLATLAQLAAARRLARHGIIVRNPRTIEALGRVDVLCVDKTGTLTEGRIRMHGATGGDGEPLPPFEGNATARAIFAAALRATPTGTDLRHATDRAVVEGAALAELDLDEGRPGWVARAHLPFGHDRAYHAVLGDCDDGAVIMVKGAPETVLERCTHRQRGRTSRLTESGRRKLAEAAEALAAQGLRVLCVAMRDAPGPELLDEHVDDLVFLGFITLSDPIRDTSSDAVRALRDAGIAALMITGDHPQTAHRIGLEAGLVDPGQSVDDVVVNGAEIDHLSDAELATALVDARVVARATPLHKVRIVRALQSAGHTVAMTGDGGNDASAIRLADVGIALGRNSSRAAQHAADMIVVDPHLETIVDGIAEGRAMWPSVRDAVALLIGGNLGEIGFSVVSGIFGKRDGLSTRQLLLINLLTDIAPAIAIALRPPSGEDLRQFLRDPVDTALGEALDEQISNRALATGGAATAAWALARALPGGKKKASSIALLALVGSQIGQTLVAGGQTRETYLTSMGSLALLLGIVETPGVSQAFDCRPIGPIGLGIAGSASVVATFAALHGRDVIEGSSRRLQSATRSLKRRVAHRDTRIAWPFVSLDDLVTWLEGDEEI